MVGDHELSGYAGYDQLWRLATLSVTCEVGDETEPLPAALHPEMMTYTTHRVHEAKNPDEPPPTLPRAKTITLKLDLQRQGADPDAEPERRTIEYAVPFALPGATTYAGGILLTEEAEDEIDIDGLASILFDAYYQENKENIDDEMTVDDAQSHMRNLALAVMADDTDRRREMIAEKTLDAARGYAPRDQETVVRMRWNEKTRDWDIAVDFKARDAGGTKAQA